MGIILGEAMDGATHAPLLPETNLESRRRQPAWALLLSAVLLLGIAGCLAAVYGSRHGGVVPASLGGGNISPEYDWTNTMLSWQRTAFHFQPPKSWMNDPNGPLYYKGWYHLFYQANPASAVFGNISWGHAVSRDLLHWRHLPLAMAPDHWYDINGVWSGSATQLPDGRVVMLYTGITDGSVQVQLLAEPADPSDPLLRSWIKSEANPVLLPPPGVGAEDFRDPTTAWRNPTDSAWRVAVGSQTRDRTGQALLFRTEDFLSYDLAPAPLHAAQGSGMWECVDFFPVHVDVGAGLETSAAPGPGVKHVLKASMADDNSDYYAIGTYHAANDTWTPETAELHAGVGLRYDHGKFYASKTFYDPVRRRRVLWAWVSETDTERADILKGWASLQSIPRTLVMDTKTGSNLLQWPVVEVENLRTSGISFDDLAVQPGSVVPLDVGKATQLDIEAVFHVDASAAGSATATDAAYDLTTSTGAAERGLLGPFGLLVLADEDLSEQTAVYFYLLKAEDGSLTTFFGQDELRSSKANDLIKRVYGSLVPVLDGEDLSVRILVDHSIVESFAQGGRVCITSRVYPTKAIYDDARVFLFNNATDVHVTVKSLKIWELNSA